MLTRWKEFAELQEVENTLLNAGRNLEWACSLLHRCVDVSVDIDEHKLYQALNILEEIQQQMAGLLRKHTSFVSEKRQMTHPRRATFFTLSSMRS